MGEVPPWRSPSAPLPVLFLERFDLLEVDEVPPFHLDRTEAPAAHEFVNRRPRHATHLRRLGLADQRHAVRERLPLLLLSHKRPFIRLENGQTCHGGVSRCLSRRVQVWWIPEGLKWGWLNSVRLILRPGTTTVKPL